MSKKTRLPFELVNDERGNILIPFALMSTIAIVSVGGAVDMGRAYQQRSKLQNVLDSALISGLAKYQQSSDWSQATSEAAAVVEGYYSQAPVVTNSSTVNGVTTYTVETTTTNSNGTTSLTTSTTTTSPTSSVNVPVVKFSNDGTTLSATATMQSSTPFLQLVLGQNFPLTASGGGSLSSSNAVASAYNPVEVSMMVDLTGSMGSSVGGSTKIAALKAAGLSILDILLPDSGANDPYVRVAIAPFADYVNAGTYASSVTNLAATSTLSNASAYANATDLAKTGHGAFSGSYSGVISNQSGSQSGSTPSAANTGSGVVSTATGASAGTPVTSGGGTYTSGYCATPTWTTAAVPATSYALITTNGKPLGIPITGISTSSTQPSAVAKASSGSYYQLAQVGLSQSYSGYYETLYYYGNSVSSGNYIPMLSITSQGGGILQNAGRDVGIAVPSDSVSSSFASSYFKYGTYWKATGTNSSGNFTFGSSTSSGWYLPIYNSYGTPGTPAANGTYSGCENTNTASAATPPSSLSLVSCVTERNKSGVLVFDDTAPSSTNGWVGSYANRSSTVSNYSSNGKCNVAGRELAPVIPLTNSKSTLQAFFNGPNNNGPLIGGGTPGHLGTAWAWYLLSPNWNSIWNLTTAPAPYTGSTTKKYAILMTDGEYNEYYYSSETGVTLPLTSSGQTAGTSGDQALQMCQAMKNQGITVITIGFGYSTNNGKYTSATTKDSGGKYHWTSDKAGTTQTIPTSASTTNSESNAVYVLSKCASPAATGKHANYYFPYSQSDLADTFASIGLTTQPTPNTQYAGRLTQ